MDMQNIRMLASYLDNATLKANEVERLTLQSPSLDLKTAYCIQDEGIKLRLDRGEKRVGYKMGLTSKAKRDQMNLDSPIYGVLTDKMQVEAGGLFSLQGAIHPKIEPEIAFIISRTLRGAVSMKEVLESCSGVCAAMEILDSRFLNFKYFSLPDVVADNCSSSFFVLSKEVKIHTEADLDQLEMVMSVDGNPVQCGVSNDISGHPLLSVVQLCEMLTERGHCLEAGSIVLAGAATQAVPLVPHSEVSLYVKRLGTVSLRIKL